MLLHICVVISGRVMPDWGLGVNMDIRRGFFGVDSTGFLFFGMWYSETNEQFMHYSFMLLIPDFVFVGGYSVGN